MTLGTVGILLLWGLIATVAMTTIMYLSFGLGFSRLSLSFLAGTLFTGHRPRASIIGFVVYALGGWLFALFYVLVFITLEQGSWWLGALFGLLHGVFLLAVILPLLPYIHPRMASEYDGPSAYARLEPPGFMGLNYGRRTPLVTLLAQMVYGAVIGFGYTLSF